ncbi:hypothetical protein [Bacillus cereus group sp. BceL008]|uniref:hypothetical protein n=1 Tax=Bacillus cereus group sp. BceL008 TaxID=3445220 RepID=UPI003F23BB59
MKVNLNDIEEENVLEEQKEESFTSKVRRFDTEEPVKKKKKDYTPGPKKKRPETKVKTYNLDLEVIKKIEEKSEEMGISASVFVNRVLREELKM